MPAICCDELAYAVTMRVVSDGSLGPAMRVRDPEHGESSYIPITFCPWCAKEIPRTCPTPPVTLNAHP